MENDPDTERIEDLMEESETDDELGELSNAQAQEPSTSSSGAYRARRTVMTPSPLLTEDCDTETEEEETPKARSTPKKNDVKSSRRPQPASSSKKRKSPEPHCSTSRPGTSSRGKGRGAAAYKEVSSSDGGSDDEDDSGGRARKRAKNFPSSSQGQKKQKTGHSSRSSQPASQNSQQSLFSQPRFDEGSFPGIIKTLHLQNFMCHSNFTHHFHRNLNFITGQNGSGKSALLSGLLIALGGKATVTSRTSSIKSLIQKGKSTARVSVTLLNKNGLQKYGDEITIERWMNISGSGGYRIKSTGGETETWRANQWRQLKKPELDNIMLGLNIQIDNPVAILNQEVARSFLRSKDPKVKFNLFYEGTLLSKLERIGEETQRQLEETDTILTNQRVIISSMGTEITHLKAKVNKISELNQIKAKLGNLHHEYLWSLVIEQEKMCAGVTRTLDSVSKDMDLLAERLTDTQASFANLNEETITREQTEVRERLRVKKQQLESIRSESNKLKTGTVQLRMKIKTATGTVTAKEAQIEKLVAQIDRVKAEQDAKDKEESTRDQQKLDELQNQRKSLENSVNSMKGDADNFQLSADKERDNLNNLELNARGLKTQIEMKKRSIHTLSRRANKFAVFGPKMEQLTAKIKANAHKFRKTPRGPLGACVSVKDPKYAALIEGIFWNNLRTFVVDNARDLALLREYINDIFKDDDATQRSGRPQGIANQKPGIVMMKFADQAYDFSQNLAAHESGVSLYELLEIENDDHIVLNTLIDITEMEKILLFPDTITATRVMKNRATWSGHLKFGYSLDWYRLTPAPELTVRVLRQKNRAEILTSGRSREAEKESLLQEIHGLEAELKNLEPQRAGIQEQEKSFRLTYNEKVNEISDIRRKMGEIANEIKRQQNKISQRNKRCDLTSYYEELEELREEVKNQCEVRDNASKEFEEVKPNILECEAKKKKLERELEDLGTKLAGFQEEREKLKGRREEVDNLVRKFKAKIASLEATKATATKDFESRSKILEEKKKSAKQACAKRIETRRSPNDLRKDFESLKERIKESEAQLGDIDDLRRRLLQKRKKYTDYVSDYSPLSKMHKVLSSMFRDQQCSFERTKTQMGRTLSLFFSAMAKQRGYEGRLLLEHSTKELYYFVCPDGHSFAKTLKVIDAQQSQSGKNTAQQTQLNKVLKKALVEYSLGLSGGERSFATICFIMALWQVMECPFYMLDEFDVFMDAFNRKTSQVALMAHARKFDMNQFVLFTPLDIGEIPNPEDACVLRLFPPKRDAIPGGNPGASTSGGSASRGRNVEGEGDGVNSQPAGGRNSDSSVENIDPMGGSNLPSRKAGPKPVPHGRKRRHQQTGSVMGVL